MVMTLELLTEYKQVILSYFIVYNLFMSLYNRHSSLHMTLIEQIGLFLIDLVQLVIQLLQILQLLLSYQPPLLIIIYLRYIRIDDLLECEIILGLIVFEQSQFFYFYRL